MGPPFCFLPRGFKPRISDGRLKSRKILQEYEVDICIRPIEFNERPEVAIDGSASYKGAPNTINIQSVVSLSEGFRLLACNVLYFVYWAVRYAIDCRYAHCSGRIGVKFAHAIIVIHR